MYFPYLRGKQYELEALRTVSQGDYSHGFIPIIEPVRDKSDQLFDTLEVLNDNDIEPIIIINPQVDELVGVDPLSYSSHLKKHFSFLKCIAVTDINFNSVKQILDILISNNKEYCLYFRETIQDDISFYLKNSTYNIFNITKCSDVFIHNAPNVVVVQDAFPSETKNELYGDQVRKFSSINIEYKTKYDAIGFGDYMIKTEKYKSGGGPAIAVTIHLTFVDHRGKYDVHIKHCTSNAEDGTSNQLKKFLEALGKLIYFTSNNSDTILDSQGLKKFKDLHQSNHYPGLGKSLCYSLIHHIETLSEFSLRNK
ncbi:sce7725 family protein [Photobacterium galatheae]|uniref:Uncharacterized protein n=1 Tax=Photobacterium galatheae TaxID=1654360 RepID=A0A066RLJ4_9GAMM|nr:sce7725 family protein [Photobacterium galatheae]KDM91194.1 hypothetical protein EA58_13690 [Photobacterium galatheae]MCM0151741.1 sce7725 family protein [Photobacterium galatheae]